MLLLPCNAFGNTLPIQPRSTLREAKEVVKLINSDKFIIMSALVGIPSSNAKGSGDPEAKNEDVSRKMNVIEKFLTDIQQIAPTIFEDPRIEFFQQERRKRQAPGKYGIFNLW